MEKVAIILVNYNGLEDTIECIQSIYRSDYTNYEIIVVDNFSRESSDILNNYEKVKLIKLNENKGFGAANNIGAEYAIKNGFGYVMCLNNDTVIAPDTIRKLVNKTNAETITTGAIYYFDDKNVLWYGGGEVSRWMGNFQHKNYKEDCNVSFVSGCCFMMDVTTYKKIGLFEPEYFMYYEDADFSLKARKNGISLRYISNADIWHKVGKSINKTIGRKDYYLTRNRLYILEKYKKFFFPTAFVYFLITRVFYLSTGLLSKENIKPIWEGLTDYWHGKMGMKSIC